MLKFEHSISQRIAQAVLRGEISLLLCFAAPNVYLSRSFPSTFSFFFSSLSLVPLSRIRPSDDDEVLKGKQTHPCTRPP